MYLGGYDGPVEIELGVDALVARVDGQGLAVRDVGLGPVAALEQFIALVLLLLEQLGTLSFRKYCIVNLK